MKDINLIPHVIFRYSWIYDDQFRERFKLLRKKSKYKYPTKQEIIKYKEVVEELWRKDEEKIFKELSKVTGLKWKEKEIKCYLVGSTAPFSDPLTIGVFYKHEYFKDVLTHELIHQLFIQNKELETEVWKYFHSKYKDKPFNTRIHIPLHAIHEHIFRKLFGEKRLNKEIKTMSAYIEYKKSWDIVLEEGYKNIIKEFKERLRDG